MANDNAPRHVVGSNELSFAARGARENDIAGTQRRTGCYVAVRGAYVTSVAKRRAPRRVMITLYEEEKTR